MRQFPLGAVDLCGLEGGRGMSYLNNNDSFPFRNSFGNCLSITNTPIGYAVFYLFYYRSKRNVNPTLANLRFLGNAM